jgi:hypothetical protein
MSIAPVACSFWEGKTVSTRPGPGTEVAPMPFLAVAGICWSGPQRSAARRHAGFEPSRRARVQPPVRKDARKSGIETGQLAGEPVT